MRYKLHKGDIYFEDDQYHSTSSTMNRGKKLIVGVIVESQTEWDNVCSAIGIVFLTATYRPDRFIVLSSKSIGNGGLIHYNEEEAIYKLITYQKFLSLSRFHKNPIAGQFIDYYA